MASEDLPQISESDVQSDEAEKALEGILRKPDFILRKDSPDYGVDYVAELGVGSDATNVRFQIQLKSEARGSISEDGSTISVVLKVSSLNYLHRGAGEKILVIYDRSTQTLYYEWVHELIEALDKKDRPWRMQKSATVHVPTAKKLSLASAKDIHARVLSLSRRPEEVERAPLASTAVPDQEAEAVLSGKGDSAKLLNILRSAGTAFVAGGMAGQVIDVLSTIPPADWYSDTALLLVAAYAHSQTGSPLQALYHANLVEAGAATLTEDDRALLEYIRLSARLDLGQLEVDSYYDGLDELAAKHSDTIVGLQCGLEGLHRKVVYLLKDNGDPWPQLQALVEQARQAFEKLKAKVGSASSLWSVELLVARIECEAADQQLMDNVFQVNTAEKLGYPLDPQRKLVLVERTFGLQKTALDRCERIYKEACDAKRADMAALALLTGAQSNFKRYQLLGLLSPEATRRDPAGAVKHLEILFKQSNEALRLYKATGQRQMAFRASRLCADILNVLGRSKERDELLNHLALEAKILGYSAGSVNLSSQGPKATPTMDTPEAQKAFWAAMSDETVKSYALRILDTLGLPRSRLSNALKDVQAGRLIYQEQQAWCKHLEMLQDLRHTRSKDTYYAIDPNRSCICKKLGHRTQVEDPDPATVIKAFKGTYCQGCTAREPASDVTPS